MGSNSELQELVRHWPGHVVQVTYRRAGRREDDPRDPGCNTEGRKGITRMEVDHEIQGATLKTCHTLNPPHTGWKAGCWYRNWTDVLKHPQPP